MVYNGEEIRHSFTGVILVFPVLLVLGFVYTLGGFIYYIGDLDQDTPI